MWSESANRANGESANQRIRDGPHARTTLTPKLLFLTSPNNPDGSLLAPDDLRRLLDLPLMVVLDEAYIEFAGLERSVARWVPERENLIVLRTFSKWAGIAGLRLGYGIFPGWLMPALWKAKQPYNVNVAATVAGLASLAHRAEIQTHGGRADRRARAAVTASWPMFPFLRPYPSRANFVLCRVEGRDAQALKAALAQRGDPGAALRQAGAGELHPRQRGPAGADGCAAGGAGKRLKVTVSAEILMKWSHDMTMPLFTAGASSFRYPASRGR